MYGRQNLPESVGAALAFSSALGMAVRGRSSGQRLRSGRARLLICVRRVVLRGPKGGDGGNSTDGLGVQAVGSGSAEDC